MTLPDDTIHSGSTDTTSSPLSLELAGESSFSSQVDPSLGRWLQGRTDQPVSWEEGVAALLCGFKNLCNVPALL